ISKELNISRPPIYKVQLTFKLFSRPRAPRTVRIGRPQKAALITGQALLEFLLEKPTTFLDKIRDFLFNKFNIKPSILTIYHELERAMWSRKVVIKR
ncbi:hypothetical protein K469DRAFT_476325, partial [Zopfia rhizophila CBS 207.26]